MGIVSLEKISKTVTGDSLKSSKDSVGNPGSEEEKCLAEGTKGSGEKRESSI